MAAPLAALGEDLFDSMIRNWRQLGINEAVTYALHEDRAGALTAPAQRRANPSDGWRSGAPVCSPFVDDQEGWPAMSRGRCATSP